MSKFVFKTLKIHAQDTYSRKTLKENSEEKQRRKAFKKSIQEKHSRKAFNQDAQRQAAQPSAQFAELNNREKSSKHFRGWGSGKQNVSVFLGVRGQEETK